MLAKVREWNRKVPEIHIGGDPRNPVIRVQLSDVDYESVVENAKGEDNEGRRRELLKDLVREALGITERDPDVFGVYAHPVDLARLAAHAWTWCSATSGTPAG